MDMLQRFNSDNLYIINELKKIAYKKGSNIYLVGGAVRDTLLDIPVSDLDFCLDCDPEDLLENLPFSDYSYNKEFKTAKIRFKNQTVDLIMMRRETYKYSGALPSIEKGNLYDDLYRRDFTINSLAYDIKNNNVIDYFSGLEDIKNKKIRKIHENSYNEDGTRIFRAVKYKIRYGFNFEDEAEINKEINNSFLSMLSHDRIIKEIILILKEDKWIEMLKELVHLNIMDSDLDENYLYLNKDIFEDRLIKLILSIKDEIWIQYFTDNNLIDKNLRKAIFNFNSKTIFNKLLKSKSNFEIYSVLNKLTEYDYKFLMSSIKTYYKVLNYKTNLCYVTSGISGQNLLNSGFKGKEIGNIIKKNMKFKLNTLV